jgi:CDP-glucose 4,6-dehydratase
MHYLITGHTGFKGSWLAVMLRQMGHTVSGVALDPTPHSLYIDGALSNLYQNDFRGDIRNQREIANLVTTISPDVVIHFAAQSLVLESYENPHATFETNVMGTLNVLKAIGEADSVSASLIVTTDKVYRNWGQQKAFVETDPLGGDDPYSASKAAADLAAQSWIRNFARTPITIARAGNVIGAGDWAQNRLIPDLIQAHLRKEIPILRNPKAIRPWQHVLDCLTGYLTLLDNQLEFGTVGEWNFGPDHGIQKAVSDVADHVARIINAKNSWNYGPGKGLYESDFLMLDSTKSRSELKWKDKLDFESALELTVSGYQAMNRGVSAREVIENQVENYLLK